MTEHYDEGMVGGFWGSSASGILYTTGQKVLLLLRSEYVLDPLVWGIPGGAIPVTEKREKMDALLSAQKETQEEIGVDLGGVVRSSYVAHPGPRFSYTTFIVAVPPSAQKRELVLNWENDEHGWFSAKEAMKLDLHPGVLEVLQNRADEIFYRSKRNLRDRGSSAKKSRIEQMIEKAKQSLAASARTLGRFGPPDWPIAFTYFASGSSQPGEIRGFAEVGHPFGVTAPEVSKNSERELVALRASDAQVFVDSGAVAAFGTETGTLSERAWEKVLSLYERLGEALGGRLSVVAPDVIGNQAATLTLQRKYAPRLLSLRRRFGVRLLVPLQVGPVPLEVLHGQVEQIFGPDFSATIPYRRCAASLEDVTRYLKKKRPRDLHLLGIGPRSPRLRPVLDVVARECPGARVTCDSAVLRQDAGRKIQTEAAQKAEDELCELRYSQGGLEPPDRYRTKEGDPLGDETDEVGFPHEYLSPRELLEFGRDRLGLKGADLRLFLEDTEEWLHGPHLGDPEYDSNFLWYHHELETRWREYRRQTESAERRRLLVGYAYGGRRPRPS